MVVPREFRMVLLVRLIMPWRLPAWPIFTLPVPVKRKRFFALLFVFSLGILLSSFKKLFNQWTGIPFAPGHLIQYINEESREKQENNVVRKEKKNWSQPL